MGVPALPGRAVALWRSACVFIRLYVYVLLTSDVTWTARCWLINMISKAQPSSTNRISVVGYNFNYRTRIESLFKVTRSREL